MKDIDRKNFKVRSKSKIDDTPLFEAARENQAILFFLLRHQSQADRNQE